MLRRGERLTVLLNREPVDRQAEAAASQLQLQPVEASETVRVVTYGVSQRDLVLFAILGSNKCMTIINGGFPPWYEERI